MSTTDELRGEIAATVAEELTLARRSVAHYSAAATAEQGAVAKYLLTGGGVGNQIAGGIQPRPHPCPHPRIVGAHGRRRRRPTGIRGRPTTAPAVGDPLTGRLIGTPVAVSP